MKTGAKSAAACVPGTAYGAHTRCIAFGGATDAGRTWRFRSNAFSMRRPAFRSSDSTGEWFRRVTKLGFAPSLKARGQSPCAFTLQPRATSQGGDPSTGWNGSTSFGMCNACECQRQAWVRPGTAGRTQPVLPCRPGSRRKSGAEAGYTLPVRSRQAFSFFIFLFPSFFQEIFLSQTIPGRN